MQLKYTTLLVTLAILGVSATDLQDNHAKGSGAPLAKGRSAQDMVFNQFHATIQNQDDRKTGPASVKKIEMDEDENEMDENEVDEDENEPDENSPKQRNAKDRETGRKTDIVGQEDTPAPSPSKEDEIAVQSTKAKESQSSSVIAAPPSSSAPVVATSSSPAAVAKSAHATPVPASPASSSSPTANAAPASTSVSSISLESLSFPAGPSGATAATGGKPPAATATGRGANRGLAANRRKNAAASSYSIPTRFSVVAFVIVAVALF